MLFTSSELYFCCGKVPFPVEGQIKEFWFNDIDGGFMVSSMHHNIMKIHKKTQIFQHYLQNTIDISQSWTVWRMIIELIVAYTDRILF